MSNGHLFAAEGSRERDKYGGHLLLRQRAAALCTPALTIVATSFLLPKAAGKEINTRTPPTLAKGRCPLHSRFDNRCNVLFAAEGSRERDKYGGHLLLRQRAATLCTPALTSIPSFAGGLPPSCTSLLEIVAFSVPRVPGHYYSY